MNFKALVSILPTVYAVVVGLAYLHMLGLGGMLAISAIGVGSSMILANFLLKER